MNRIAIFALAAAAALAACKGAPPSDGAAKPSKFTPEQLDARFYYDLGPSEVDFANLPKDRLESAKLFAQVCSQCHTAARPLNSPIATKEDWSRYVRRMHERTKTREWWAEVPKETYDKITDFLAYDSKIRKIDNKRSFDLLTENLKQMFVEVQAEQARLKIERDDQLVRQVPDFMAGVRPQAGD